MKAEIILDKRSPLFKINPEFNICLETYSSNSIEVPSKAIASLADIIYKQVNDKFTYDQFYKLLDSAAELRANRLAGSISQLHTEDFSKFKQLAYSKYLNKQKEEASKNPADKPVSCISRCTSSISNLSSTALSFNCSLSAKACLTAIVVVAAALLVQYLCSANQDVGNFIDR